MIWGQQKGYRASFIARNGTATLCREMERCLKSNRPMRCAFLDYRKAFDELDRRKSFRVLTVWGVPAPYADLTKRLYEGATYSIKFGDAAADKSNPPEVKKGRPSGQWP